MGGGPRAVVGPRAAANVEPSLVATVLSSQFILDWVTSKSPNLSTIWDLLKLNALLLFTLLFVDISGPETTVLLPVLIATLIFSKQNIY